MADNSTLPVSVGTEVFANDDIASVKYPRVKVTWGPDGTANDTDVASGKPLPAQIRTSGGTAASFGSGTIDSGTLRVAIPTDQLAALQTTAQPMSAGYQLVALPSDQGKIPVHGDTASGSTDANSPVKTGGQARTTNPTAVTDAQRVNFIADKLGKQIVVCAIRDLKGVTQTQISASTSETTIVTAAASTFFDLYGLILANTGATAVTVTIKDSTAGTTRTKIYVPAGDTRGFMLDCGSALVQSAVNNNWTATCSASTTAMEVTAMWVKNT
jgi:hypothetical protein